MASRKRDTTGTIQFSSEATLVQHVLNLLPGFLAEGAQRCKVAVELSVGRAIADIVVVVCESNDDLGLWPLSIRDCVVLANLRRGGPTRIDLLEERCGLPRYSLRNGTLKELEAGGFIKRRNGGRVELGCDWLGSTKVIAIEVKLNSWREAVCQAQEYLRYADQAYVALPGLSPAGWKHDVFSAAGVGLLQVGAGRLEATLWARHHVEHDWRREFAVSRVLTAGTPLHG